MKTLQVYNCCPLLFWTIIAIASKESREYSYLYLTLMDPVRRLANDIHSVASKSVPFIQALLLLCTWPFPYTAKILDRSWSYCGTATHIALELGLHRPRHISDFVWNVTVEEETLLTRRITWLACFIVNHK
jgi:Fungal specific transcription factor domain